MTFSIKPNTERLIVFGIIGLAIALRVIAAIVIPDQGQALPDVPDYRNSAEHFLRTG